MPARADFTIAFYVSGHGFGHASRVIEVMHALAARHPPPRLIVRSGAPRRLFELTGQSASFDADRDFFPGDTDTGVVQIDSLRLDAAASVARAREFMARLDTRADEEGALLRRENVSLVVADVPPLGIAAAGRAGIPAVALGNFTWDWIYSRYPHTRDLVDAMAAVYGRADLALRLPMHGGFAGIETIVDVPFVARRSRRDPAGTRRILGLPRQDRLVLTSFGGYGLAGLDLRALAALENYRVLVSGEPFGDGPAEAAAHGALIPLDERRIYAAGLRYEDLVRAVDVVVTKPGYGIIAECIANETAMLYTSRGDFIEYEVLVAHLPRFLRARFIDHGDLFAGRWGPYLDALLAGERPAERPRIDGAEVVADRLTRVVSGGIS